MAKNETEPKIPIWAVKLISQRAEKIKNLADKLKENRAK